MRLFVLSDLANGISVALVLLSLSFSSLEAVQHPTAKPGAHQPMQPVEPAPPKPAPPPQPHQKPPRQSPIAPNLPNPNPELQPAPTLQVLPSIHPF